jgi:hypothetical protein
MNLVDLHSLPQGKKQAQEAVFEIGPDGTSLTLLQAVYRNPAVPLHTRIRCAAFALPYEHPKLMVTAVVQEHDLASLLDARLRWIAERESGPNGPNAPKGNRPEVEVKPPLPRLPDRRYRRY